jgi:hypothetical protein
MLNAVAVLTLPLELPLKGISRTPGNGGSRYTWSIGQGW